MDSVYLIHICVFILGVFAAFFGASAGGSGLLIIPGLFLLGFPVKTAIVALEVGALGMMITGAIQFHRKTNINYKIALPVSLASALGGLGGSFLLVSTPPALVEKLVAVALLLILAHLLISNSLGVKTNTEESNNGKSYAVGYFLMLLNGIWTGFFSAGSHIFGNYILLSIFKRTFLQCAGILKIEGLFVGLVSASIFFLYDMIDWPATITLFIAMAFGAHVGSQYGIEKGNAWVKSVFLIVVSLSSLKLLF